MKQEAKDYLKFLVVLIILNLSGPLAVFLPLPFFIYKDKFSFKSLFFLSFIPIFVLFPFLPDKLSVFASLLHYGSLVIPSLFIIYLFRFKNLSPFYRLLFPSLSILLFVVGLNYFANSILGDNIFYVMFEQFFKASNLSNDDLTYIKNVFHYAGYGLIFLSEAMFFLFNAVFFPKISGVLRDFVTYKVDVFTVVFTVFFILSVNVLWITGNLSGFILQFAATISLFLFFIFFVQGLSIYMYFLDKVFVSGFAKAVSLVLIFFYPLPVIVALAGILDFWIDFRARLKNIGGGKVV